MDTSPATSSRSPTRRAAARTNTRVPLQERTSSQTNKTSGQLGRGGVGAGQDSNLFQSTPFPTKPQHVLLPSTIRKQKSFRDGENTLPVFFTGPQGPSSRPSTADQSDSAWDETKGRRAPVLQLQRSVTTLRDMYEAQAERSRPSTAASFAPGPGTPASRLRSASSSDGLSGRNAWEQLHKISADDMALLPTLSQNSIEKMASASSFASRAGQANFPTSSPNYRTYGTSSPSFPVLREEASFVTEEYHQSSSSGMAATSSSSPNFVRLGRSSSIAETLNTEESSSSPNFVKLGTSSSGRMFNSSPTPSDASDGSRKRKRTDLELETSSIMRTRPFSSSPPYVVHAATNSEPSLKSPDSVMPSSPPHPENNLQFGTSSPIYRLHPPGRNPSDSGSSSSSTHANLQRALSSSPMPPIQYPIIRAPPVAASTLNIPKRGVRKSSVLSEAQWISRLSPVPSEWDEGLSRNGSNRSYRTSEIGDEVQRSDSIIPESVSNDSQIHIVTVFDDDDHLHEATDELRALPRGIAYRPPPLVPQRTNSLFGTTSVSSGNHSQSRLNSFRTSMDSRLNSMKSYAHSRQNSLHSGSVRPSSSGSQSTSVVLPTWARRYYSGLYRDSFQYLYPSQPNSTAQISVPKHTQQDRSTSMTSAITQPQSDMAASRNSRRSWQSVGNAMRRSIVEHIPSIIIPRNRQRPEARKSHMTMGVGPLVSNPIDSDVVQYEDGLPGDASTLRRVSSQLPPADPRAHWAGITDEQSSIMQYQHYTPYHSSRQVNRQSSDSQSVYYDAASGQAYRHSRFLDVPNLHRDRRLNTGSSKSRGFGFPFNQKGRYNAPGTYEAKARPAWFRIDLRNAQVFCFVVGFLCPVAWFAGALLPLPKRPESYEDLEKTMYEQQSQQANDGHDMDIVARLRLERHIKGSEELEWQNARWWKRMNRWMSIVGLVVFVLAIVLAVIGTRNHW